MGAALVLMALAGACAAPQASAPTSAPTAAAAPTKPAVAPASSPAASPAASPSVVPGASPAATIPPQPTAVLIATPPPSPVAGATLAAPTAAATVSAQPVATGGSPVPAVRTPGELPAGVAGALAVIETRNPAQDPGFLTPMEILFQFAQPIAADADLRRVVDAVQAVPGVAAVKSDGVNMLVQYDSARLEPAQIRQLLDQLGFAFAPGTDVPSPGSSRD